MTRPRICSPAAIWTDALAAVVKVRMAAPVGTSSTAKLPNVGITPVVASRRPKANAAPTSKRMVGRARRAASTAPISDPRARVATKVPYVAAEPPNSYRAARASVTEKLRPNAPTKPTRTIGSNSSRRETTYRKPSRSCPRARRTGRAGRSSSRCMARSAARTAR